MFGRPCGLIHHRNQDISSFVGNLRMSHRMRYLSVFTLPKRCQSVCWECFFFVSSKLKLVSTKQEDNSPFSFFLAIAEIRHVTFPDLASSDLLFIWCLKWLLLLVTAIDKGPISFIRHLSNPASGLPQIRSGPTNKPATPNPLTLKCQCYCKCVLKHVPLETTSLAADGGVLLRLSDERFH